MELPSVFTFTVTYLVTANIIGFLMMGLDKLKAKRRAFRVPEATLFLIAIVGGSVGSMLGMYIFHHKTRHLKFIIGMPVVLFIQLILGLFFVFGPFFDIRIM